MNKKGIETKYDRAISRNYQKSPNVTRYDTKRETNEEYNKQIKNFYNQFLSNNSS